MEYKTYLNLDESKEKFLQYLKMVMDSQMENCKESKNDDVLSKMYNIGLYNGIALSKAIFLGIEPEFYDGEKIRRKSEDEK